jgi:hypothetical protein
VDEARSPVSCQRVLGQQTRDQEEQRHEEESAEAQKRDHEDRLDDGRQRHLSDVLIGPAPEVGVLDQRVRRDDARDHQGFEVVQVDESLAGEGTLGLLDPVARGRSGSIGRLSGTGARPSHALAPPTQPKKLPQRATIVDLPDCPPKATSWVGVSRQLL